MLILLFRISCLRLRLPYFVFQYKCCLPWFHRLWLVTFLAELQNCYKNRLICKMFWYLSLFKDISSYDIWYIAVALVFVHQALCILYQLDFCWFHPYLIFLLHDSYIQLFVWIGILLLLMLMLSIYLLDFHLLLLLLVNITYLALHHNLTV